MKRKQLIKQLLSIAEPDSEVNDDGQIKAYFYVDDLIRLIEKLIQQNNQEWERREFIRFSRDPRGY